MEAKDFINGLLRYPLERLVYFVAALLPGTVALLIYWSVSHHAFDWFFKLALGYDTKLWLFVLAAFAIGHTVTSLLRAVIDDLGFWIGGMLSRVIPHKASYEYEAAPWRNSEWRKAVRQRLGDATPKDSELLTADLFQVRTVAAQYLPPEKQAMELMRLAEERISTQADDIQWKSLYQHYHFLLLEPDDKDVVLHIKHGLTYNFLSAAIYVLTAATMVRTVHHWWCVVPSAAWVVIVLAQTVGRYHQLTAEWSTLQAQTAYLATAASGVGHGGCFGGCWD